jgi:hypothetical protein
VVSINVKSKKRRFPHIPLRPKRGLVSDAAMDASVTNPRVLLINPILSRQHARFCYNAGIAQSLKADYSRPLSTAPQRAG